MTARPSANVCPEELVPATFPTKLGRYQIVKHLANGGMAQVLLARATGIEGFERHVVVKRIHQNRAEDPVFVKMFLDEARLAAQLHHNNIVQVHDIGKEKGEYFFAMEYVHGEDLRKLLMTVNKKKEKVPFEHVVTIVTTCSNGTFSFFLLTFIRRLRRSSPCTYSIAKKYSPFSLP
ncbi:MAG: protein kinase, partial [Deltaproteobacteria bacterium]|nr:protein kinase [Deltaproteobacteria bacterium]